MYYKEVESFFNLIFQPEEVHELRCLNAGKWKTISGYFNDVGKMAKDAKHWSDQSVVPAVYFTLNPVNPALLSRCSNRSEAYAKNTTSDADIIRRRLILIDFDPTRPSGISSTEEEHTAALKRCKMVREWLGSIGFPEPILGDSGNGAHLLYRVDLPNDASSTLLIKSFLESLATKFNDNAVSVDLTTFNASRISKVYWTITRKGDNTPDRPHRRAQMISAPDKLEAVPRELLEKVVGEKPQTTRLTRENATIAMQKELTSDTNDHKAIKSVAWVDEWVERFSVPVSKRKEKEGVFACVWEVDCPWCEHHDGSACILVSKDGAKGFTCHHNSCKATKHWKEFRTHYEPDYETEKEDDKNTLLNLVEELGELWHDGKDAYITANNLNHKIGSDGFGGLMRGAWFKVSGCGISDSKFGEVVETAKAMAMYGGCPKYQVHHRVARHEGKIYLDMGDTTGGVVEISTDGWKVVESPPVKFVRSSTTGVLPTPVKTDDNGVSLLRKFVNLSDSDFTLFVGSLLDGLKGRAPYLITPVSGEHGSAKSTLCRIAVRILDPQTQCELRSPPRDEQALAVSCVNRHVVAIDNVSKLPDWLSDGLCRVATGGGWSARKLYTDGDEVVMSFARPIWLNGIEDFVHRSDLASRCSPLFALRIEDDQRRDEGEFWTEFQSALPIILGSLYSAVAHGLRAEHTIKLDRMPRMADSSKWLASCLPAFGWDYSAWATAFEEKQTDAEESILDGSLVASCLFNWWCGKEWELTPQELYDALWIDCPELKRRYFPVNPRSLTSNLRRLAPSLRKAGLDYSRTPKKKVDGASVSFVVIRPIPVAELPKVAEQVFDGWQPKNATNIGEKHIGCQGCQGFTSVETKEKREVSVSEELEKEERYANPWQPWQPASKTPEKQGEMGCRTGFCCSATFGNHQQPPIKYHVEIDPRPNEPLSTGEKIITYSKGELDKMDKTIEEQSSKQSLVNLVKLADGCYSRKYELGWNIVQLHKSIIVVNEKEPDRKLPMSSIKDAERYVLHRINQERRCETLGLETRQPESDQPNFDRPIAEWTARFRKRWWDYKKP